MNSLANVDVFYARRNAPLSVFSFKTILGRCHLRFCIGMDYCMGRDLCALNFLSVIQGLAVGYTTRTNKLNKAKSFHNSVNSQLSRQVNSHDGNIVSKHSGCARHFAPLNVNF